MELYSIRGNMDSELENDVFGTFSAKELADKAYLKMPEEFRNETTVTKDHLPLNCICINGQIFDFTAEKTREEVLAARTEDNWVTGYIRVHISDIIDRDYEGFLDFISEALVGSDILMDIDYSVVGFTEENEIILKVSGDASTIVEDE